MNEANAAVAARMLSHASASTSGNGHISYTGPGAAPLVAYPSSGYQVASHAPEAGGSGASSAFSSLINEAHDSYRMGDLHKALKLCQAVRQLICLACCQTHSAGIQLRRSLDLNKVYSVVYIQAKQVVALQARCISLSTSVNCTPHSSKDRTHLPKVRDDSKLRRCTATTTATPACCC